MAELSAQTRKSVADLSLDDLEACPVWEYALDEESRPGQDETTVRPCLGLRSIDPVRGGHLVKCLFFAKSGRRYEGFCTAVTSSDLSSLQPVILTAQGPVRFWYGAIRPKPQTLAEAYERLGRSADEFFPAEFRALLPVAGTRLEGRIEGFGFIDWDDGRQERMVR